MHMYVRLPVVGHMHVDNTCVDGSGRPCLGGSGRPCVGGSGRPCAGGSGRPCVGGSGRPCVGGSGWSCVGGSGALKLTISPKWLAGIGDGLEHRILSGHFFYMLSMPAHFHCWCWRLSRVLQCIVMLIVIGQLHLYRGAATQKGYPT